MWLREGLSIGISLQELPQAPLQWCSKAIKGHVMIKVRWPGVRLVGQEVYMPIHHRVEG